jgi:hypothetical protein
MPERPFFVRLLFGHDNDDGVTKTLPFARVSAQEGEVVSAIEAKR